LTGLKIDLIISFVTLNRIGKTHLHTVQVVVELVLKEGIMILGQFFQSGNYQVTDIFQDKFYLIN